MSRVKKAMSKFRTLVYVVNNEEDKTRTIYIAGWEYNNLKGHYYTLRDATMFWCPCCGHTKYDSEAPPPRREFYTVQALEDAMREIAPISKWRFDE